MKQVKVNNILYVMDTEAYQITEDTDARLILVPEDSYEDYVAAQWGQPGELITGDEVARIQDVLSKMQKYNYNCIVVNVPEYVTAMEEAEELVVYISNEQEKVILFNASVIYNKNKINYIKVDGVKLTDAEIDGMINASDWNDRGVYNLSIGNHIVKYSLVEAERETDYNRYFDGCRDFVKVIIPSNWKYTGQYTFTSNYKLEEVIIKSTNITTINTGAFYYTQMLNKITLPNTITKFEDYAFKDSGFENFVVPEGVTEIGTMCFYQCRKLKNIVLPSTITKIGGACFAYSTKLEGITINATSVPTLEKEKITDEQGDLYYNNAFDSTNNCPIYVPAESVAAYKAATNWSKYASRIQAIPSE